MFNVPANPLISPFKYFRFILVQPKTFFIDVQTSQVYKNTQMSREGVRNDLETRSLRHLTKLIPYFLKYFNISHITCMCVHEGTAMKPKHTNRPKKFRLKNI